MAVDAVVSKSEGFGYGGRPVFTGEIIRMQGYPNDGKLLSLGYLTRYDASMHDHDYEVDANGRRFITAGHHQAFLRRMADEASLERQRHNMLATDQRQLETVAIEQRGLKVVEQRGPMMAPGATLSKMTGCPIDGCGESVDAADLHDHVEGHSNDAAPVVAAKPTAKPAVAKRPAAKPATKVAAASKRRVAASRG